MSVRLLVIVIGLVVDDVEELELVDAARGGDDAEPVAQLVLLEELLGPAGQNATGQFGAPSVLSGKRA